MAESHRNPGDLLDLAAVYALHAVDDRELRDIDAQVADADPSVREQFYAIVRDVRESMARLSSSTAVQPPSTLRTRILANIEAIAHDGPDLVSPLVVSLDARRAARAPRRKFLYAAAAAAAAVVLSIGGVVIGQQIVSPQVSVQEQILASPDVRTVAAEIPGGGVATVIYSRSANAGVLVMNNVTPPSAGTVYQMWLVDEEDHQTSAGIMAPDDVAPSTTAVLPNLGRNTTLGFTVEPPGGSAQPTGDMFAAIILS